MNMKLQFNWKYCIHRTRKTSETKWVVRVELPPKKLCFKFGISLIRAQNLWLLSGHNQCLKYGWVLVFPWRFLPLTGDMMRACIECGWGDNRQTAGGTPSYEEMSSLFIVLPESWCQEVLSWQVCLDYSWLPSSSTLFSCIHFGQILLWISFLFMFKFVCWRLFRYLFASSTSTSNWSELNFILFLLLVYICH